MTTDQLRQEIQNGTNRLLGLPGFLVSQESRTIIEAMQRFWLTADDATLAKLLAIISQR